MAATNRLDGLDDALLREGRFDLKLRIDLPDEAERLRILEARLHKKPSSRLTYENSRASHLGPVQLNSLRS